MEYSRFSSSYVQLTAIDGIILIGALHFSHKNLDYSEALTIHKHYVSIAQPQDVHNMHVNMILVSKNSLASYVQFYKFAASAKIRILYKNVDLNNYIAQIIHKF